MPIVVFTTVAMLQLGTYSYTRLGGTMIMIQAGYVVLLLVITILLFILKKKDIALRVIG